MISRSYCYHDGSNLASCEVLASTSCAGEGGVWSVGVPERQPGDPVEVVMKESAGDDTPAGFVVG